MEKSSTPLEQENGYSRSPADATNEHSKELRRKKRIKYLLYFVAFVIFQTGIIVLFTMTIMKIRTPKFRVQWAAFESFSVGTEANPSFNFTMNFQLGVKNTNFGTFKYESTTMYLFYRGSSVGQVSVPRSTVGWRSTKKIKVFVNINSFNLPANNSLRSDLRAEVLPITTQSNLNGKVKLIQVFKKKKSIELNCSLDINTASQQVSNIACK